MKALLAVALTVLVATTPEARGVESVGKVDSSGLQWRCHAIPEFERSCIQAAVKEREATSSPLFTATSHEAGTRIALDFGAAVISGDELTELLLAADSLLPGHIGTIEVRKLVLEGSLHFNSTDFRRALTLDQRR